GLAETARPQAAGETEAVCVAAMWIEQLGVDQDIAGVDAVRAFGPCRTKDRRFTFGERRERRHEALRLHANGEYLWDDRLAIDVETMARGDHLAQPHGLGAHGSDVDVVEQLPAFDARDGERRRLVCAALARIAHDVADDQRKADSVIRGRPCR